MKFLKLVTCILALSSVQCSLPSSVACDDKVESKSVSPNQKYVATLFVRNCGATTDYSTIVKINPAATTSTDDGDQVFVARGDFDVQMIWQNDSAIRLSCQRCKTDDIFKQDKSWRDVAISY